MDIGNTIKKYREERDLTQTELAKQLGVSQGLIAQFERGSKIPSMILGKELAAVLSCTVDDLYGERRDT